MGKTRANTPGTPGRGGGLAGGCLMVFGLAVLVLPFALIAWGVREAVVQDRHIRTARPVEATIVSSKVGESRGRRGRKSSQAVIVFRYEVAGRQYRSNRNMANAARGRPEGVSAQAFVAAHPPGATVQAYYVPDEPSRAFLLKKYNFGAYVPIFCGLGFLAVFLGMGLGDAVHAVAVAKAKGPPPPQGWLALSVPRPLRARVSVNLVQAAVYLPIWGWVVWHCFTRVPDSSGVSGYIVFGGLGLPGLWYLWSAGRAHFTRRAVSDARVAVREAGLRAGGQAEVQVEQDLLGAAVPERVRMGVVCEKTTGSGKNRNTAVHWETWTTLDVSRGGDGDHDGAAAPRVSGRRLSFAGNLPVPADQPASKAGDDPRYAWKLIVETALANCPDYRESYDLHIRPAKEG